MTQARCPSVRPSRDCLRLPLHEYGSSVVDIVIMRASGQAEPNRR